MLISASTEERNNQAKPLNQQRQFHCLHQFVQTCYHSVIRNSVLTSAAAFFLPLSVSTASQRNHTQTQGWESHVVSVNELWPAKEQKELKSWSLWVDREHFLINYAYSETTIVCQRGGKLYIVGQKWHLFSIYKLFYCLWNVCTLF